MNSRYHWGFIIGPKNESREEVRGLRCNVRNYPLRGWTYEETKLQNVKSTNNLLARIRVAKIEDEKRLLEILRETPLVQDDPEFRCRTWMADVLSRIANSESSAVGTSELDWSRIEQKARRYVEKKAASGRYLEADQALESKPTWDMMEQKEIVE